MRAMLVLCRAARSFRPVHPRLRTMAVRRLAGPPVAAIAIAGATVTAVLGGSAAGGNVGSATAASAAAEATAVGDPSIVGDRPAVDGAALASRPFRAGEQGVVEARLPAVAAVAQMGRAALTASILGLPAAARRDASRVVDRFGGRTYDEVAEYDVRHRLISLQRFGLDGRLLAAVRFGWRGDGGPPLTGAAGARLRAEELAASLGLETTGVARIVAAPSKAGWTVAWDRIVAGVPVPGDGLRFQLWPDGSVHSLSRSERALAPRPAVLLEQARARAIAEAQLARWFHGSPRREVTLTGLALAWVPPNDTFAAVGPDAPGAVLRLAWVARVKTSGGLADSLRGLEIYLDAGDGSVFGGDVLR